MALAPRLLKPKASFPKFSLLGYSRLWCVTNKNTGNIAGVAQSDTGYYVVKWWDNTTSLFENGDTFSKAAAGMKAFEVYPAVQESTSLLLHLNESGGFSDSSGNNLTVSANGGAAISTTQSKFGGASVYFDGSGDYLSTPSSEPLNLTGSVPYTIELWMYIESYSYAYTTVLTRRTGINWQYLIGFSEPSTTELFFSATSQGAGVSPGYSQCRSGFSLPIQQWHHVAATVSNGVANLFINGILVDAQPWAIQPDNAADLWFAQQGSGGEFFNGYIDELRIVKGKAIYGTFNPPTAAFPDTSLADPHWASVSLLLHMDGANNSTSFVDSSSNALTVTANGTAKISTNKWKFGGASADLSSGSLTLLDSVGIIPSTADFTVEAWIWLNSMPTNSLYAIFGSNGGLVFGLNSNAPTPEGGIFFEHGGVGGLGGQGGSIPGTQRWFHVAICRSNGKFYGFIDGFLVATKTYGGSFVASQNYKVGDWGGDPRSFDGHIDELRVTNGVARYTSNFTPPTAPLSPIATQIVPYGQFDGFNISDNSLAQVRAENVSLLSAAGQWTGGWPGFWTYWGGYYGGNPGNFIPGVAENGILSDNSLSSAALNQFYSDLSNGTGSLWVDGNPGISGDTPTIATSKGYTVYGSVPPQTSLLMNFNGSNGSTSFVDSSPNSFTVTVNGAEISTTQSKWGGSSGYFDGVSDYLVVSDGPEFDLSSGAFTIEMWFYATSLAADISQGGRALITKDTYGSNYSWSIVLSETQILVATANIAGDWDFYTNQSVSINEWHHVALCGDGLSMKMFFDGVLIGTKNRTLTNGPASITIGCSSWNNPSSFFEGYIDDLRIVKGKAIYGNFDPPLSAHPSSSLTDPYWSSVSILLHMDGTDGSTSFADSSNNTLAVTAYSNAQIDSGKWKFGGASAKFDGSGDYLSTATSSVLAFDGDDDFTIEAWVFPTATETSDLAAIVDTRDFGGGAGVMLWMSASKWTLYTSSNGNSIQHVLTSDVNAKLFEWTHLAAVRQNGILRLAVNGVFQSPKQDSSGEVFAPSEQARVLIGTAADSPGGSRMFTGNIDDIRITKGIARFTANFTPPTAPLGVYP